MTHPIVQGQCRGARRVRSSEVILLLAFAGHLELYLGIVGAGDTVQFFEKLLQV